jgi:hypothetical protein
MIKPANKNGKSRVVHQNLLKKCFGAKITSVGCSDVQLLGDNKANKKNKKVRFKENKTVIAESAETNPRMDENNTNRRKRGNKKVISQQSNNNVSNSSIDIQRKNKNVQNQAITNSEPISGNTQDSNASRFPRRSRKKPDRYDSQKLYP